MAEQEEKTAFIKLSAETLKQYALLEISNSCSTRRGKEAHPKAVLSTKPPQPEDATSPCDTTPVATCKRVLSSRVVSAPNCTAMKPKRQFSTSVDPVSTSGEKHPAEGFVVLGTQGQGERNLLRSRPKDLELKRNLSSHSSSGSTPGNPCSPAMMCSPSASEDTELGLVHSYPGPAPMPLWRHHQEPACKKENQHLPFHCQVRWNWLYQITYSHTLYGSPLRDLAQPFIIICKCTSIVFCFRFSIFGNTKWKECTTSLPI